MHLTVTDTELKHLDCFQGFSRDTYFKIRQKNLFCHLSLIFVFNPACMKTCHLSASSFAVSPLQFLSSAGGILRIISLF